MSLATASCDLWQNEHLKVSSGDLGFTPTPCMTNQGARPQSQSGYNEIIGYLCL